MVDVFFLCRGVDENVVKVYDYEYVEPVGE